MRQRKGFAPVALLVKYEDYIPCPEMKLEPRYCLYLSFPSVPEVLLLRFVPVGL
jgi:hypothetical protein